ncbi:MAG: TonB-dependent receptor [Gammaproteobacteria bacterium]|jgi:outer membrane receptor protein involved in Fe transport|nr:TonB-dependent receptor [Gammaproteobacteria bacterium]MBT3859678.1 TonB-dependent receptor [Gammaproteobacteria bacterium]MBT3987651.1 TonB-dependent receptor [Gammaproteobacteria bacterium]MBT4255313.1 TonB-dependent receptor [Gammaproteobacteria bacterium]MBT4581609.1 TonB-dependent receptor [Gammaproteobacteria bacterium]
MRNKFPSKRRAITIGVILAGLSFPVVAQDDIEEVLVTGSFIRGSALDAPSPVQVIDRANIESQGASAIWDVVRNMEVNQGSETNVNGGGRGDSLAGTASVSLRNLGGNSTLTLINGKRFTPAAAVSSSGQEMVDLNSIPLVMTDRIEVLTDGGSALYGSDAVAGVVNVIMRTDFEGLEIYADTQGIQESGGTYEETVSAIWGWGSSDGDTNFVISGEFFERDPVPLTDASYFDPSRVTSTGRVGAFGINSPLGGNINPAYIHPALSQQQTIEKMGLGENVSGTRGLVFADPLCESLSGNYGDFFIDNRFSGVGRRNGNCVEDTLSEQYIAIGTERTSVAGSFEHTFSDSVEFYSFFQHSDTQTRREGNEIGFSRSLHVIPAPGWLGVLAPYVGNAPVGPILNNPTLASNGGFGEGYLTVGNAIQTGWPREQDNRITDNRTAGIQAGLRGEFELADKVYNFDVSYSASQSSIESQANALVRDRTELALYGLGGESCVPNGSTDFNFGAAGFGFLGFAFDEVFPNYVLNTRDTFSQALTSTNQGQGDCHFFNPYLTALTDPALANDPAMIEWITERDYFRADKQNTLEVFDAVVSGELFEMTGGTAQFAAGYQHRSRKATGKAPEINQPGINPIKSYSSPTSAFDLGSPNAYLSNITNNLECANCIFNFSDERSIDALFLELSLPFMENVETQIALRYEDYGDLGDNVSPKVALSWRPIESLLLRASYSQSFRAPNIGVVNQAFEASGTTFLDPLRNQDVRAGLLPATNENGQNNFSFTVGQPNPNLGNEEADTFNVGFQWTPSGDLDGLTVGADVWRFEVQDRVLPQVARDAIEPELAKFNSVVNDPSVYVLNNTIAADARDADGNSISCDPNALEATFGRDSEERRNCVVNPLAYQIFNADGSQSVQRNLTDDNGALITLALPAVNAGNIDVQGIDFKAAYNWESDWGRFNVGLSFTHIDEYSVSGIPGLELGLQQTGKFDAAGGDGEGLIVREVPDNKGTLSFSWARDNHSVSLFNRHVGSYQVLGHRAYIAEDQRTAEDLLYAKSKVDSYDTWDLQYTYNHQWDNSNLGATRFSLGVIDLTSADVPLYRRNTFDQTVYDGRGARWYARALWSF